MQGDILAKISHRIKEIRREKNITLQELADRVKVTKGMVSQIENSRALPSLTVLIEIIKALEIDLNEFFKDMTSDEPTSLVLIKRAADYEHFEKEDAIGFAYQRVFNQSINKGTVDIVLLQLERGSNRPMVQTDAYEYKYFLEGTTEYHIGGQVYLLYPGDSMLFDGRIPHTPKNAGNTTVKMLVIYFFESI
jgi:transcriptional regulator with XRE-family HTH domain